jgi:hypothetical protein
MYHEKICKGLTVPTWDYLTDDEADAMLHGKYKGDGRRIDAYVVPDQKSVEWDDE